MHMLNYVSHFGVLATRNLGGQSKKKKKGLHVLTIM